MKSRQKIAERTICLSDERCRILVLGILYQALMDAKKLKGEDLCRYGETILRNDVIHFVNSEDCVLMCEYVGIGYRRYRDEVYLLL